MLLPKAICTLFLMSTVTAIERSKEATNIASYDPGELLAKIFNPNTTVSSRQRGYGLVFEDQPDPQNNPEEAHSQYGLITFEENNKRLKFEDDYQNYDDKERFLDDSLQNNDVKPDRPLKFVDEDLVREQVNFQDDNNIDQGNKRKKRRRRRKPKNGLQNYQKVPQSFQGRGRRRPRPSLASDALTAVTGALTSIALYDDYQCVPRLLCEAAGGGTLGSTGVLDSVAGIQPLLSLLSAYNGISASPLFVFGRAVFLGMTSRGNTGTCRYAYPQCPTDPEQLIHYLNNHNGGFFRFFNAPLPNQNLEQFYNQLGQNGQNLEQFYDHLGQNGQYGQLDSNQYGQQSFGQYQQDVQQGPGSYGLYQNQALSQQGYGLQNYHIGNQIPGLHGYGNQNYGSNYGYNTYGSNNVRYKDAYAKIEKRIQNKPIKDDVDERFEDENNDANTKWQFPEETNLNDGQNSYDYSEKDGEVLKFPEESQNNEDKRDSKRKGKSILFPENQYNQNAYSNKKYVNKDNQNEYNRDQNNINNNYNYNNGQKPVNYVNYNNYANSKINDAAQTVYIVRGNGDPNRPEIVK
ncbi:Uncharacterized protein OBRU01_00984, partial [Operophtera brumata]